MTEEEVIKLIQERLRVQVKTKTGYYNDKTTTVQLILIDPERQWDDGLVISEAYLE